MLATQGPQNGNLGSIHKGEGKPMKTNRPSLRWIGFTILILSCASGRAQVSGQFISFDVPGAIDMGPTSLTPDGKITGVYTSSDGHQHGFLLSSGQYQTIDFPGGTETGARWINPRGEIVGEYTDASGKVHGYLLY